MSDVMRGGGLVTFSLNGAGAAAAGGDVALVTAAKVSFGGSGADGDSGGTGACGGAVLLLWGWIVWP